MHGSTDSTSLSLFRIRAFRPLFATRVAANTANQMQTVAIGWQVYEVTGSALDLGLIGLVQFLPPLLLTLVVGHAVDRSDRRDILRICYVVQLTMSAGLLALAAMPRPSVVVILLLLLVNSIARTFEGPALQSLLPHTVPNSLLMRAVSAHASAGKLSQLLGPPIGGALLVFGGMAVYAVCAGLIIIAEVASFLLPPTPVLAERPKVSWAGVVGGLTFIWNRPVILGAMTLDLAASLFGGVTALLPIFARDILEIGPWGFGLLRSAPALGALALAMAVSRFPVTGKGGEIMFGVLAAYGGATLLFGLSQSVVLSFCLLMIVGASDMMGTIIRQTIIQVSVPDHMRGRVFAVNTLFVGTGGHLGTFESGVTAAWFGAVGSAVFGGAAVFVIIAIWLWRFPSLRRMDRPDQAISDREPS
jgi:MFS family permease